MNTDPNLSGAQNPAPSPMPDPTATPVTPEQGKILPNMNEQMTTAIVDPNAQLDELNAKPPVEPAAPVGETMTPPPVAPTTENTPAAPTDEKPKKKKTWLFIVIGILAAIIVGVGGYVGYIFIGVKPQSVHEKVVDKFFNEAGNFATKLTTNINPDAKTIKQTSKITFESNIEGFDWLKNYEIKYNLGMDSDSNYSSMELSILEKNNEIFGLGTYFVNNKMYLNSKQMYDSMIELGEFEFNTSDTFELYKIYNEEDIKYLISTLEKAVKESLKEGKYERKLETVKVNGKDTKAFNNSYMIDEAGFYKMTKTFLTTLKNDDKALEIIAKDLTAYIGFLDGALAEDIEYLELPENVTAKDVKKVLEEAIKEVDSQKASDTTTKVYFNIYTGMLSNDVVAAKLIVQDGDDTYEAVDYYVDGDLSELKLYLDEDSKDAIVMTTRNNSTDINLIYDNNVLFTIGIVDEEKKTTISLSMDLASYTEGEVGKAVLFISTEGEGEKTNSVLSASVATADITYELKMKTENTVVYDEKIEQVNVSKSIPIDDVDEEKINENLSKALEGTELYSMFEGLIGSLDFDDYDDYDYDDDFDFDDDEEIGSGIAGSVGEYSEHCNKAKNCECSGSTCNCSYLDDDWNKIPIVCPND